MTPIPYKCPRCSEPLGAVELGVVQFSLDTVMVRPLRVTKCKYYKPGDSSRVCKGGGDSIETALEDWEDRSAFVAIGCGKGAPNA